jgi:broad specificity phosphatase PhoE
MREAAGHFPVGPVAIVSHGLTIACLLCWIHGYPLEKARQHIPANGVPIEVSWP